MATAIQSAVERVILKERASFARRLALVHVALGVAAVPVAILAMLDDGTSRLVPTLVATVLVLLAGVAMLALAKHERSAPHLGWVIPLVDLPIIAGAQIIQVGTLPVPLMSLTTVVGLMAVLSAVSVLSLSSRVVIATTALGGLHVLTRTLHLGVHFGPVSLTMFAWVAMGFSLVTAVNRVAKLVTESRRDDLLGKYVLGRRIGAGGMAEVYEATYSPEGGFERRVAVKKILPAYAREADAMQLFRREAELGAQLAHPHIVQVLDFGAIGDTYFLAMEYVDGAPLSAVLDLARREGARLPLEAVVTCGVQLADALDYVHERTSGSGQRLGLVHRDINPPNIMVTRGGDVKLADFGIARSTAQASVTAHGVLRGKLAYASPEQLLGQPYDARADLYAVGITLHELLTARRLFTGTSEIEVMKACLEGRVAPPSELVPGLPPEVDAIVMKLLERDVGRRTQSAAELLRQLEALPATLTDLHAGRRALGEWVRKVPERPAAALAETPQFAQPGAATVTREVGRLDS